MMSLDLAATIQFSILLVAFVIGNVSLRRHMDTRFTAMDNQMADMKSDAKDQWSCIRAIDRKVAALEATSEPKGVGGDQ